MFANVRLISLDLNVKKVSHNTFLFLKKKSFSLCPIFDKLKSVLLNNILMIVAFASYMLISQKKRLRLVFIFLLSPSLNAILPTHLSSINLFNILFIYCANFEITQVILNFK